MYERKALLYKCTAQFSLLVYSLKTQTFDFEIKGFKNLEYYYQYRYIFHT